MNQEVIDHKYTHHQIVKHLAGLFIRLSDISLIPFDKSKVLSLFKIYVDFLFDNNHLPSELNHNSFEYDRDGWGGLGFSGRDLKEFEQFEEYLNEKIELYKVKCIPNIAGELIELMQSDTDLFTLKLIQCNREENLYYNTPILKDIDPNKFVEILLSLPGSKFRQVGYMFKHRYSVKQFNANLLIELEWLKNIESLLEQKQIESRGKLSGYRISLLINGYIKTSIEALEEDN
ncbi:hypothetical protein [Pseudoalteromonas piscicida]|uniref:Uncharacterized protein n=1 Tax=Pseudoalteromonas piscicida TaxID=43662 RepID=A0AAD0RI89_PSEO7|nr:hypothetical protein [Pseudoalteromonas piscicida]ASD66032.1 hypothetical protein B1L02_02590 [Pseudoalteromonas piscicida]AXR03267.1 hypothetical protein D0511_15175 [Pseudoalteromonas piscicida]